jgi:hypothetical protein
MSSTALFAAGVLSVVAVAMQQTSAVSMQRDDAARRVTVAIGGRPFTSYNWGPEFPDKPVFYPVLSPGGARVNREYPMVPGVAGESSDHPHHQSLFFTYDEVNGTNFWNPEQTGRRIVQRALSLNGNSLTATLEWRDKDNALVLEETKRVTFGGASDMFWMDHDITLRAGTVPVTMGDTKEGAFGLRLNDTLKEAGGSGRYVNADGLETAANVWGKRSPWVAIRGAVTDSRGTHDVTVAIYAHPSGLNAPPYWHARDYGLFAANPFARKGYDATEPERITRLAPGGALNTRFRVAVYDGKIDKARLDRDYDAMAGAGR